MPVNDIVYQVICKKSFNYLYYNRFPKQFKSPYFWIREYPKNQLCWNKKKKEYPNIIKINNEFCNRY